MKKSLRIVSLILAVVLAAACFAGCNGSSENSGKTDAKTFKIGGIGPLTDTAAQYGIAVKNAAEIAVKEINEAGGVNGYKLEFQMQDDVADPEKSVTAYNALKDWGMQILAGTVTTGACLSVIDKTKTDNMFQLTPSASAADVVKNDNCFQVCFTDPNQGSGSAKYIADNKLAEKIAVIYDSSDAYSSGIYNKFKEKAAELKLNVVSETTFTKDSKTDFSAQIGDAKSKGADLVFLPIYYQEASLILTQCKSAGYAPKFFGCDGLDGLLGIKNFDKNLAEGVMLLTPFAADAKDEATQKFVKAYKEAYNNETPSQFAADAYDVIYIIAKLLENSKVTPDMSVSDICNKLKDGITSADFKFDGLTGKEMSWSKTGEVNKDPQAVAIKNGAYAAMQ